MSTATATRRERLEKTLSDIEAHSADIETKGADASAEDYERLEKLNDELGSVLAEVEKSATAGKTIDAAKGFLGGLSSTGGEIAEPEVHGESGIVNPKGMTLGEALVKSPAYEEFLDQYKGNDGKIREVTNVKSASFEPGTFDGFGSKTVVTGLSSTSGGALVINDRYPVVTDLIGERELTVEDLVTKVPTTSDAFEFVRITAKTNNAAAVLEATTAADPAAPAPAGAEITDGGYKPESALTLAVVTKAVETIAHLMPITRRAAADAPQVRSLVDQFLLYGLAEEVEDQILNGSGTTPQLAGILNDGAISTVGSAGTDLDAVVDAIRTIRNDRRRPTAMVIHPNDWFSTGFLLAKDSTGRYLIGDPNASVEAQQALWGLRVVVTEAMTENTVLVGDFRQAVLADRQQSAIYVTDSHKDWFGRNLLAVLAERRLALGILDPDAFCTVTAV